MSFDDPIKLLAAAEQMGLEGIVSRRKMSPYRSGPSKDWVKVKTAAWRAANKDRWEMFKRG
jgi:ATP-dependent DNA ligase